MPSSNLELVQSIFAAWARGDYSSVEWADLELEYVIADGPAPGTWIGLGGLADWTGDFLSAWDDARVEADECRELDGDRVLMLVRYTGRGKRSGLEVGEVGAKGAWVFHVRDGKVTKLVRYWDRERALAELGLGS